MDKTVHRLPNMAKGTFACEVAQVATVRHSGDDIRLRAVQFSQARAETNRHYFAFVQTAQMGAVNSALKSAPPYQPRGKAAAQEFSRWEWFMDFMGSIGGDKLGRIPLEAVTHIAENTAKRIEEEYDLLDSLIAVCEQELAKPNQPATQELFGEAKSQLDELKHNVAQLYLAAEAVATRRAHEPA